VIYTVAIPESNPELVAAREQGIPAITYPQALGIISKEKYTIAISGTHGKDNHHSHDGQSPDGCRARSNGGGWQFS
jgi:UDP-N-acetylmuramate-alanine ligase